MKYEPGGGGDKTGDDYFQATVAKDKTDKAMVSYGDGQNYPGDDNGPDFTSVELG